MAFQVLTISVHVSISDYIMSAGTYLKAFVLSLINFKQVLQIKSFKFGETFYVVLLLDINNVTFMIYSNNVETCITYTCSILNVNIPAE